MNDLVVSNSPFIRSKNDVNKMFLYVSFALFFPAIYGIILFELNAFLIILVSIVTCAFAELLFNLFNKKKLFIDNLSFLVTGLVLALTLPSKIPLYAVAISAFFSIFIVKMVFGGLGRNVFNPALTGRCLAGVIVPAVSSELYACTIRGESFTSLSAGGENIISNLLVGYGVGGIGTTFIIILILIFFVLAFLRVIDAKIPIFAVAGYLLVAILMVGLEKAMINIFSGSFLFVSIFVLTDPNTSPNSLLGKFIFGFGFGVVSFLIWNMGLLGENAIFVVALLFNVLVPFMDKFFVLKPVSLGGFRHARKN